MLTAILQCTLAGNALAATYACSNCNSCCLLSNGCVNVKQGRAQIYADELLGVGGLAAAAATTSRLFVVWELLQHQFSGQM